MLDSPPPWLWALVTLAAALLQTFRNAAQKSLTGGLGALGATHVRFLYGLPFALLFLAAVAVSGDLPHLTPAFLAWAALGALAQVLATMALLAAMEGRSFVVVIAYSKTEPVQIALFGLVLLGEAVTPMLLLAILVATLGVVMLSWPKEGGAATAGPRPVVLGILSGGLFALAAVGFRGAVTRLDGDYLTDATVTLAVGLALQAALLSLYLAARALPVLIAVARAWRVSLAAGFLGASASQMWFLAFALETAARVRTLALVEVLIAGLVSRSMFREGVNGRDAAAIVLVVLGAGLVLNA